MEFGMLGNPVFQKIGLKEVLYNSPEQRPGTENDRQQIHALKGWNQFVRASLHFLLVFVKNPAYFYGGQKNTKGSKRKVLCFFTGRNNSFNGEARGLLFSCEKT